MLADVLPESARLVVARPSNHSGPGRGGDFVIPGFAAQIARAEAGGPTTLQVGNLNAERDFLDVRDVVNGYIALLASIGTLGPRSVFNVAAGRTIRVGSLLEQLRAMARVELCIHKDPARVRPSEVPVAALDATAIHTATGWFATIPLEDTLAAVLSAQRALTSASTSSR